MGVENQWCESEKVTGITSSFDHGFMKGLREGAKCGDYVLAERWGEINPRVEFDMSGEGCGGSDNYDGFVSEKMADEAEKW